MRSLIVFSKALGVGPILMKKKVILEEQDVVVLAAFTLMPLQSESNGLPIMLLCQCRGVTCGHHCEVTARF